MLTARRRCTILGEASRRAARVGFAASLVMLAVVRSQPLAAQVPDAAAAVLRHGGRFDVADLRAIEAGEPVVRPLVASLPREVALLGVIRLEASADRISSRLRDLRVWLRTPTRQHVGLFSVPPTLQDLAALEISATDVRELQKCRPGSCTTKLSQAEMERAQREMDWSAPDLLSRITVLARQRLLRLVDDYRSRGDAALPIYADRDPRVASGEVSDAIIGQSVFLQQQTPSLAAHLRIYPAARMPGASDVLYWSENVVSGLRPTVSLTHAVTVVVSDPSVAFVVASKQLYANHYFEGALEIVDVVERRVPGEPSATYVVIERRFRFDNLPRGLLNIRGRAANALRDQLLSDLRRVRSTD